MAMYRRVKVFFDGGWRPATGMETAVVVRGREYVRQGLGPGSAMEAEWLALLHALEVARELGLEAPVFLGDALAVIAQASGAAPCRKDCAHHVQALAALRSPARPFRIAHIKRSQNLAGIALAHLHER
jgi:ribonuclease HI